MSETKTLDLDTLKQAVSGGAAAFRCRTILQPAGGQGDKVFPPTYEKGAYATEKRIIDGEKLDCVVLDSVASQANRIELALLHGLRRGMFKEVGLPNIEVNFTGDLKDIGSISHLEAPHRIADAILRDSTLEGTKFRETDVGKSFTEASVKNATALFAHCPTALILGLWDSTGPKGGQGAKFQRCLVSEIVGIDVEFGKKTSSRIDPLQIPVSAGKLYATRDGGWTLDEKNEAVVKEAGKAVLYGNKKKKENDGKPSRALHGNITPTVSEPGGVTLRHAIQFTTLSLPALRRLQFPVDGKTTPERDAAAQTALAALALCGVTLAQAEGLDLRSRCLLAPVAAPEWELVGKPGESPRFSLSAREALVLLQQAVGQAAKAGLRWETKPVVLTPLPEFVRLVINGREQSARGIAEEE